MFFRIHCHAAHYIRYRVLYRRVDLAFVDVQWENRKCMILNTLYTYR